MNRSKNDLNKSETEQHQKKHKNIREIYLQALNSNREFKNNSLNSKKKGFTNLTNEEKLKNNGASNYLEKELTLVQRIISDTKELKHIKTKNKNESYNRADSITTDRPSSALPSSGSISSSTSSFSMLKFKSPEDYSQEILELKKAIKMHEENETIFKAKFEYYENEMSKKEKEIVDLLDVKKAEEIRLTTDPNKDLPTLIYGLKQKCFKLEFALKRKQNELNKLKTELKTTNIKELKAQNDRLRFELSKALMNDIKIIEDIDHIGGSSYESKIFMKILEILKDKQKSVKKKYADILNGELNQPTETIGDMNTIPSNTDPNSIMRINELEKHIIDLNIRIDDLSKENSSLRRKIKNNSPPTNDRRILTTPTPRPASRESRRKNSSDEESYRSSGRKENSKIDAINTLKSVLKGHVHRSNSLNRKSSSEERQNKTNQHRRTERKRSSSSSRSSSLSNHRNHSPYHQERNHYGHSQTEIRSKIAHNPRRRSPLEIQPPYEQRDNHHRQASRNRRNNGQEIDESSSDDDKKELIENKDVKKVDTTSCCSPWRTKKSNNK